MGFCSNCGGSVKDDVAYCPACGKSVKKADNSSQFYANKEKKLRWMVINAYVVMILQDWMPYITYYETHMDLWDVAEGIDMTWIPWMVLILLTASLGLFMKKFEIPAIVVHGLCDIFMLIPVFGLSSEDAKGWSLSMGFLLYVVGAVILTRNIFSLKMDY